MLWVSMSMSMLLLEDVEAVKPDPELYLTAVQRLNYSPAHCLAIEDSANGATGAMNAGLDVIINTNEMTEAQDFSAITFVGKDLSFEQIKIVSLNQIRSLCRGKLSYSF